MTSRLRLETFPLPPEGVVRVGVDVERSVREVDRNDRGGRLTNQNTRSFIAFKTSESRKQSPRKESRGTDNT